MANCHYKRKSTKEEIQKKKRNKILKLSLGGRRVIPAGWMRNRGINSLRSSILGLGGIHCALGL